MKAVSGVPPSAKTAGTPNAIHCVHSERDHVARRLAPLLQRTTLVAFQRSQPFPETLNANLRLCPVCQLSCSTSRLRQLHHPRTIHQKHFLRLASYERGRAIASRIEGGRFRAHLPESSSPLCHLFGSMLHDAKQVPPRSRSQKLGWGRSHFPRCVDRDLGDVGNVRQPH
jgi:hypothetical protein